MLGSKKKEGVFAAGGHTLFDRALEIEGNIKFGGVLDIQGKVTGSICAEDDADATIRIQEHGEVFGEVSAPEVIINGKVHGDVFSSKLLQLASQAVVNGNVNYKVIEMVKGAEVNGNLVHIEDAEVKDFKKAQSEQQSANSHPVSAAKAVKG
ncbi:MAG: polymer-forming cytoskeletal protein [Cellvibrionaceae bacterium]|nr:polymer-forming cytoskeletal protein [Cellvibrionaceae bacterium]